MSRNVQSLERGLTVVEALVKNGAMGVSALSVELGLDKTIVHRLLTTLRLMGYVSQDSNRKYAVGSKLRMMGAKVITGLNLRALALPHMEKLATHTHSVSHLAKMAEARAIYIERVQYPGLTINSTDVGGEAPGYCSAAGKVMWAYLPQSELNELLDKNNFRANTSYTITDRDTLQQHLAQVRQQGYATDREEHRLGLYGFGAPIRDHTGTVIASICVAELSDQSTDEARLAQTRDMVIDAAKEVSAEMGYADGEFEYSLTVEHREQ
ncbi:MAG: IclR family transcriptional regulator [Chloroflexota bacterium]